MIHTLEKDGVVIRMEVLMPEQIMIFTRTEGIVCHVIGSISLKRSTAEEIADYIASLFEKEKPLL